MRRVGPVVTAPAVTSNTPHSFSRNCPFADRCSLLCQDRGLRLPMRCQPGDPPCIPELDSSQPFRCTHVIVPSLTKLVIFSGIIATYVVTVSTRATEQPVAVWRWMTCTHTIGSASSQPKSRDSGLFAPQFLSSWQS